MADYQKMYYILCRAADKALDALPEDGEKARQIDTAGEEDAGQ